jgi:CheY-like chemotaxis protein
MQVLWEKRIRGDDGTPVTITGPPQQKLRILVVDDHHDCAVSLSFLCRMWGHDVQFCFSGVAAIQSLATFQPDVFLLDIAMPRINGYELASELRNLPALRDALFIAISGYADAPHRTQGLDCGFNHYLAKPVDPSLLKNLLQARQCLLRDRALLAACVN